LGRGLSIGNHWVRIYSPLLHRLIDRVEVFIYRVAERSMRIDYREQN